MKKITFLLSILAILSCNGQDVCVYSVAYGDSLKAEISQLNARINDLIERDIVNILKRDSLMNMLYDKDDFINTLATENNQLITLTDNLSLQNNQLTTQNQNLQDIIQGLVNPTNTTVFIQDTIDVKLTGDGIIMTLNKIGNQKNYQLVDGLDRISLNYNSGKWELWVAYDKKAWKYFQGQVK